MHKAEGIMSTQVLNDADDWDALRTLMILNDETHITMSIDDLDRLLEGFGRRANAEMRELEAALQTAESHSVRKSDSIAKLRKVLSEVTSELESLASKTRVAAR